MEVRFLLARFKSLLGIYDTGFLMLGCVEKRYFGKRLCCKNKISLNPRWFKSIGCASALAFFDCSPNIKNNHEITNNKRLRRKGILRWNRKDKTPFPFILLLFKFISSCCEEESYFNRTISTGDITELLKGSPTKYSSKIPKI